jgi:TolB-like protein/tetratricopeptide (TPR) repeat protein
MSVQPGTRLGPYEIGSPLGAGGMGEVYRARDTRLGRDVAIKVLPATFSADAERLHRFEQEARATAALDHPNILAIHDIGTHEEQPYLVEELLEGETLRERLRRGALPVAKAVELGVQIASGLAAAHGRGIVHRDVKPENLFVTRHGHLKILDFGLAKLGRPELAQACEAETVTQSAGTGAGVVLGTVGYMAPEQVRGQPCDHRADIFALGCVLHEMLSGQRAFAGETPADTMTAILSRDPAPLSGAGREVPPALQGMVRPWLEKRPEDRCSSAHDLALALGAVLSPGPTWRDAAPQGLRRRRWLWFAAVVALALVTVAGVWLRTRGRTKAVVGPEARRVVVAVFENRTGDRSLDHLGRMISDWLTQTLSHIEGIEVVPSSSVLVAQPAGSAATAGSTAPALLAAATGAGRVVAGTYQLQGTTLVLQAQMTDAARGRLELAVGPVTGPAGAPLEAIDALAQRIAGALANRLGFVHDLGSRSPPLYDAYREFILGFELFLTDDAEALRHFEKAAALDRNFLVPVLYQAYILEEQGQRTRAASLLDALSQRREEMTPLGRYWVDGFKAYSQARFYEAAQHLRAASRLAPRDPITVHWIGYLSILSNRPGEAVAALETLGGNPWGAHPLGVVWQTALCRALHMLGEHERELAEARRPLPSAPDQLTFKLLEVRALAALGRTEEIRGLVETSLALPGRDVTAGDVLLDAAKELRAHGNKAASAAFAERAVAWFGGRVDAEPAVAAWRLGQLDALRWAERWADASRVAREVSRLLPAGSPEAVDLQGMQAAISARLGRGDEAQHTCAELLHLSEQQQRIAATYRCATVLAILGQRERAVEQLSESFAQGRPYTTELHRDIDLESLHGYPPFDSLLKPKA